MKKCTPWVTTLMLGLLTQAVRCSGTTTRSLDASQFTNSHFAILQSDGTATRLFLRRSTDGGLTFETAIELEGPNTSSTDSILEPTVRVDTASNVHVTFRQPDSSGFTRAFYSRSIDKGLTFSTPIALSQNNGQTVSHVEMSVDSLGGVHVVWRQGTGSITLIHYSFSDDLGATFSTPVQLDAGTGESASQPKITTTESGIPIVIFLQSASGVDRIWYTYSPTRSSSAFITPVELGTEAAAAVYGRPRLLTDFDGNVHVLFTRNNNPRGLRYRKSTDGGATWSDLVTHTIGATPTVLNFMVDRLNTIHVTYVTLASFFSYLRSTDGATFAAGGTTNPTSTCTFGTYDPFPILDPSDNVAILTKCDTGGGEDLGFHRSLDNGVTFQTTDHASLTDVSSFCGDFLSDGRLISSAVSSSIPSTDPQTTAFRASASSADLLTSSTMDKDDFGTTSTVTCTGRPYVSHAQ